jgi:telomerase reverse transcriptase
VANRDKATAIPGLISIYPNHHVSQLKERPWPHLLALLGKAGERVMIDLLVDGAVFTAVEAGRGNYYQLSGKGGDANTET